MNREQLEHVLRASAAIVKETSFVVIGSQAILLAFPSAPEALLASLEVDLYPALHPEKADLIDGAIGAWSSFHETFGYHADGVGPETAVMPKDWMVRANLHYIGDLTAICPDIHDLAVSKCAAMREKDADFIRILLRERMIDAVVLEQRIRLLDAAAHPVDHISAWAARRVTEAATP